MTPRSASTLLLGGRFGRLEPKRAAGLSHEDPVDRQCMKVHVQVERPTKALDDGDRPGAAVAVTRCLGSLSVEADQSTRVDRKHRAAEVMTPSKSIAKLEGKAQHPLPNRRAREHVVDEMSRTLRHPAPPAIRAKAPTLAGERNQPIGSAAGTPKPGKAVREHAAVNESLKLALHEQGGACVVRHVGRAPRGNPQVLADDAVEHPMLRSATHVGSRDPVACSRGVKLHDHRTPSRLVPLSAPAFSTCIR